MSLNRRSNLGGTERLAAPLLLGARLEQRLRQQVTGGGDRVRVGRNTFFPRTSDLGSSASPDQHLRVADSRYLDDSSSNNRPDSGLPGEPHASWLHGRSEIRTGRSSGLSGRSGPSRPCSPPQSPWASSQRSSSSEPFEESSSHLPRLRRRTG